MDRSIILLFFLTLFGISTPTAWSQSFDPDTVYIPSESVRGQSWNPYPGLGSDGSSVCITPGQENFGFGGYPVSQTLPTTSVDSLTDELSPFGSPLTPAQPGGELYFSQMPTGKRTGIFQKVNFNALWVPKSGGKKGLGMTHLDLSASFALPMLTKDSPLIITPSFQAWFFDPKSDGYMTKKTMYTTGADFRWLKPIVKDKLTLDIGVATLYSGDFHAKAKKAMRYPAHVSTIWHCNPRLKVVLGVVYLDREDDYNWLPLAGVIWTPNDDVSVELVLPRIRLAQRIRWFGSAAGDDKSDWIYTAFEFGGGSWAREVGEAQGHIDYRDYRILVGYERRTSFGMTIGFEVGYMFERELEFEKGRYKTSPADNVFLRLRTSY